MQFLDEGRQLVLVDVADKDAMPVFNDAGFRTEIRNTSNGQLNDIPGECNGELFVVDDSRLGTASFDLCNEIYTQTGVPCILVTKASNDHVVAQLSSKGILGCVAKPYSFAQLLLTIATTFETLMMSRKLMEECEQLKIGLNNGRDVSLAVGVLLERNRIDREKAFRELRESARSKRVALQSHAALLITAAERLNLV